MLLNFKDRNNDNNNNVEFENFSLNRFRLIRRIIENN
jgi:hypothetical protein